MADAVDICNFALANLGDVANITSLNPPEGSTQAERCARFYPLALRRVLEEHEWSFATMREQLVPYAENPRDHWRFCYGIPSKCVKVIEVNDGARKQWMPQMAKDFYDYERGLDNDGREVIFTNIENAWIEYVKEVNEGLFTGAFCEALGWKLSGMLAGPMLKGVEGMKMKQTCDQNYRYHLEEAKHLDSQQQRDYHENIPEWIQGRDFGFMTPYRYSQDPHYQVKKEEEKESIVLPDPVEEPGVIELINPTMPGGE